MGKEGSDPSDDPVNPQPQGNKSEDPAVDPVNPQPQGSSGSGQSQDTAFRQSSDHETAKNRLSQLSSQISPSSREQHASSPTTAGPNSSSQPKSTTRPKSKRKTKKSAEDDLPADYSDVLAQIAQMKHSARTTPDPKQNRGYARQKTSGKLWARERISLLLDPDTWREVGSVTGSTVWQQKPDSPRQETVSSFTPTNNPQGFGRITCSRTSQRRQIYLTADDFSIRSGHADGSNGLKTLHGEKLALKLKVPVVKLVDGSSGGGSVTTIKTQGYSYIPHMHVLVPAVQQLNAGIPNLGAVVGPAIGLGAARVVSTHFSVMAADIGSLFNAGPKVVQGATFEEDLSFQDLGGPDIHCRNGTIDNLAANEIEAFDQIKTVLGYLPDCGDLQAPPCLPPSHPANSDDPNREDLLLRTIIPRRQNRLYNPRTIITTVVDSGSFFEIGALWGTTSIVGLARLAGRPVGILCNNCESPTGGALDPHGSQKLLKMLKFCDVFNLPVIQFVDVPGYAIGTVAERNATMRWGVELAKAYYSTTTPIFSVMIRRCYGVAGGVMLDSRDPVMRIAWPSGEWGSLPLEGGIEVAHRRELLDLAQQHHHQQQQQEGGDSNGNGGKAENAVKQRYAELENMYRRLMNPVRSANAFNVEEIVDPKDTRSICCRWTREMYGLVMQERLAARKSGKLRPVFT